ncbi:MULTISPECIES: hypothetical protein [unclassified Sporosarcina]|uniref:hypothetical protein n=1 Tax=unclassified Sporosarcina TaxID=2647733 RepID=UPI001A92D96A|nr:MULTISPECIES: hypothetical protein [unclassified Sporosarcina]MBO0587586.1 hypothetical protein [Sporosarcina sp. E16_8]MBO0602426.1 hypothetical protein [Sporosarcina sp. E16_3]
MFSFLINNYGWFVFVIVAFIFWIVVKFVHNVVLKVLGIVFAVMSILRLWAFFT